MELLKLTRLCTVIPEQDTLGTITSNISSTPDTAYNNSPIIIIKFNNCNASTALGTFFVTCSYSFDPVASQRGVFAVNPRGSY